MNKGVQSIAILDYGVGNIKSITNAFDRFNAQTVLTSNYSDISSSKGLVIPGVGAFAHGMKKLEEINLINIIKEFAESGKPILGICLGMQMLFSKSEEFGTSQGLDLISGVVKKLPVTKLQKLPHIAWSPILIQNNNSWSETILDSIEEGSSLYHVHSFFAKPDNSKHVLAESSFYDFKYCSVVKKQNIYGCQFHPEKSGPIGLEIIQNFSEKVCNI